MGYRQAVRHRTLTPAFLGSNPSSLIYPTKTFLSEYFDRKVILLNSFISWIGGKKLLRKKAVASFTVALFRFLFAIYVAWNFLTSDKERISTFWWGVLLIALSV